MIKEVKDAFLFLCSPETWRMTVLWGISLYYSYFQLLIAKIFRSKIPSMSDSIDPSSRPICVITGATSGIGKATAFALAEKGYHVVLVGRTPKHLSKTLKDIKRKNKDAQLKTFQVDMSCFQSLVKFKNSLEQWLSDSELHPSIQLLVNNAGILAIKGRKTSEGYDKMMATNYIGPYCLTKLLFPLLQNSSVPSRIVNVSSLAHRSAFSKKFDKDCVTGAYFSTKSNRYLYTQIYEYSKLCILLFTYELHRQLRLKDDSNHVTVLASDPEIVRTNLFREIPSIVTAMVFLNNTILGILQSPKEGAQSTVDAALSTPETSGVYYYGGNGWNIESSKVSKDPKIARQLWETSCALFNELQLLHDNNNNNNN